MTSKNSQTASHCSYNSWKVTQAIARKDITHISKNPKEASLVRHKETNISRVKAVLKMWNDNRYRWRHLLENTCVINMCVISAKKRLRASQVFRCTRGYTQERSHTSVGFVTRRLHRQAIRNYMREYTQERSHTPALCVALPLIRDLISRDICLMCIIERKKQQRNRDTNTRNTNMDTIYDNKLK